MAKIQPIIPIITQARVQLWKYKCGNTFRSQQVGMQHLSSLAAVAGVSQLCKSPAHSCQNSPQLRAQHSRGAQGDDSQQDQYLLWGTSGLGSEHLISTDLSWVRAVLGRLDCPGSGQIQTGGEMSPSKFASTGKTCFSFPGNTGGTRNYGVKECITAIQ